MFSTCWVLRYENSLNGQRKLRIVTIMLGTYKVNGLVPVPLGLFRFIAYKNVVENYPWGWLKPVRIPKTELSTVRCNATNMTNG